MRYPPQILEEIRARLPVSAVVGKRVRLKKAGREWKERKGPRCIALRSIRSASVVVGHGVDLLLADNHRYRARLERGCSSTGFYSGFYVEPDDDGSLCSGRDELQARSGLSCVIDSFRRLEEAEQDD